MTNQKSFTEEKPTLYLVATPIGNLSDMTYRAVEVLNQVDLILAEDTRVSGKLLAHFNIKKPLKAYHDHNKHEVEQQIIDFLKGGKQIALITDAGTPGISDPGYELASSVIEAGFHVVSLPGASAILAAVIVSGLMPQPFTFIGFLPRKKTLMIEALKNYQHIATTLIIYESPNRIKETLATISAVYGNRKIALCRELTKKFETITRGYLENILKTQLDDRGEYVVCIEGASSLENSLNLQSVFDHMAFYLKQGIEEKEALKLVAKDRNTKKSDIYRLYKIK